MTKFQSIKAICGLCIVIAVTIYGTVLWLDYCIKPSFSSPSSGTGMTLAVVPVLFDDPNDIRYWPSIDELQWFARTKPDGLFRKISQDDYEARRWEWYCEQSARATWPEQELMVWEVK